MTIGERIRKLRKTKNLTLLALGRMCGRAMPSMSNIERGKVMPKLDTVQAIATALDMSSSELLFGVDDCGGTTNKDRYVFPPGFQEFVDDPEYEDEITEDWIHLLLKMNIKGEYPADKQDWVLLYLSLKKMFPDPILMSRL